MARAFNVDSARSTFELPELTRKQIQALILDLDMDARGVVITAIAQLWQREIGEPDRDFGAEIDELRARLDALAKETTMNDVTYCMHCKERTDGMSRNEYVAKHGVGRCCERCERCNEIKSPVIACRCGNTYNPPRS